MSTWLSTEEMPGWLATATSSAWADLQKDGSLPEIVPCALTGDVEWPGMYWVGLTRRTTEGGSISGGGVTEEFSRADILMTVANTMQHVVSEKREAWGQARPKCPHHPHPLTAVVLDGEAWWICGANNERLGRIGRGDLAQK